VLNQALPAVIDDTERLWLHNEWVIDDEQIDVAVRKAISNCSIKADEDTEGITPHPRLLMVKSDLAGDADRGADAGRASVRAPQLRFVLSAGPAGSPTGGVVRQFGGPGRMLAACKFDLDHDYSDLLRR
jgi:hypothetical protein